eukprot:TRINITY_DN998_c0_g1_i1.p1 TRINITY_DN998_c0_g1~~TRINITY_DN998_c0_g1_i1.p1  ORF type:complete len:349 (-),score=83.74 TRINITY_DN998_c0_g1_i1:18-1064(-)
MSKVKTTLSAALCGLVFGFSFEKSKVLTPDVIFQQMRFTNFIMFKMFISAVLASTFSFWFLEKMGYKKRSVKPIYSLMGVTYGNTIVGGAILGSGMALSGSCPGTVYAQLGSLNVPNAIFTFMGVLAGGLVYGSIYPTLQKSLGLKEESPGATMDNPKNYTKIVFSILAAGVLFLVGLEKYRPWTEDLQALGYTTDSSSILDITGTHWHPSIAGVLIGLLQIPAGIMSCTQLGTSTSYVSYFGSLFETLGIKNVYFAKYADNLFQKLLVLSIVSGALISSQISGTGPQPAFSTPLLNGLGGFLLLFGGRMANGCPSGHGITGMGQLSFNSLLAVGSMFAGGIITAMFV